MMKSVVIENVEAELQMMDEISLDVILYGKDFSNIIIKDHIESIVCSSDYMEVLSIFTLLYYREILHLCIISICTCHLFQKGKIKFQEVTIKYYVYTLTLEDGATETMQRESDEFPVATHWLLPVKEFHYMWENLYYDCDIKNNVSKFSR